MKGDVKGKSRKAVAAAGTRHKNKPFNTRGYWQPLAGKAPEGEPFRPGKTAREKR